MDTLGRLIASARYEKKYIQERNREIAEIDAAPVLPPPLQLQQQERRAKLERERAVARGRLVTAAVDLSTEMAAALGEALPAGLGPDDVDAFIAAPAGAASEALLKILGVMYWEHHRSHVEACLNSAQWPVWCGFKPYTIGMQVWLVSAAVSVISVLVTWPFGVTPVAGAAHILAVTVIIASAAAYSSVSDRPQRGKDVEALQANTLKALALAQQLRALGLLRLAHLVDAVQQKLQTTAGRAVASRWIP